MLAAAEQAVFDGTQQLSTDKGAPQWSLASEHSVQVPLHCSQHNHEIDMLCVNACRNEAQDTQLQSKVLALESEKEQLSSNVASLQQMLATMQQQFGSMHNGR